MCEFGIYIYSVPKLSTGLDESFFNRNTPGLAGYGKLAKQFRIPNTTTGLAFYCSHRNYPINSVNRCLS